MASTEPSMNPMGDNPIGKMNSHQHSKRHFKIEWRQLTYFQKATPFWGRLFSSQATENKSQLATNETKSLGIQEPRRILNSLDGCFRSGELSAILGPSGAGKSTFLSSLFGSKQDGAYGQTKVTWFGGAPDQETERRSIKIASLPQHDHLLNHLTVYETLLFASKIKNATRNIHSKHFHRQNVKRVAKMLKLTECLDTRCGKLSGGQYKRVSIGQELLSEPDVIILDEPTSGLDAMTCLTTIQTLKSIVTKHPMSIILTIHQPDVDVFNLFDHVYVIAQGGLAIYEGPPRGIVPTLASVGLRIPAPSYNPARFIVENAFIFEPSGSESDGNQGIIHSMASFASIEASGKSPAAKIKSLDSNDNNQQDDSTDSDSDSEPTERAASKGKLGSGYLKRSMVSLTEVISGKEMASGVARRRDKRPLLNIGIQTLDGKLITSEQLARNRENQLVTERWNLLKTLNQIQKSRYRTSPDLRISAPSGESCGGQSSPVLSSPVSPVTPCPEMMVIYSDRIESPDEPPDQQGKAKGSLGGKSRECSAKSDYSSETGSLLDKTARRQIDHPSQPHQRYQPLGKASSMANFALSHLSLSSPRLGTKSLQLNGDSPLAQQLNLDDHEEHESILSEEFVSVNFADLDMMSQKTSTMSQRVGQLGDGCASGAVLHGHNRQLSRRFDKMLSAKHNNASKNNNYPIWHHAFLLTHRTWLSIVRDPIFFGIQATMHTTIPILLALIFGSIQDEGCPRVGNFDLVDFAYSDSSNIIHGTMGSIRRSIGNIGVMFFQMFVLCFAINCITALVFPMDMYVLLKEHRNGWYSLRSYFFGRTLADLPVPIVLHSMAIAVLYFLTGQPHSWWRFWCIIAMVIMGSLVAQSVGLTIGALLMKSSQSAVLAAAGIVAPFFALSGFIVRIHSLPLVAQAAAQCSYLYQLLNGFIILRYGFGRCDCRAEDFDQGTAHEIPANLHTMASMWIGTYSNEYPEHANLVGQNKSNVDPNIDVVKKMMEAFKMANSYGHRIESCDDVLPYAMLDFNLRDSDIYYVFTILLIMILVSRLITFSAIYYKIRSYT